MNNQIELNQQFDEYFHQLEGFCLRSERFYEDVKTADPDMMTRWLRAAFMQGAESALKITENNKGNTCG